MKKLISIFLSVAIILAIPLSVTASNITGNVVTIGSFTVEFSHTSLLNSEEQQYLAQQLVTNDLIEQNCTTYNLLCTLFGHKETVESVTIIEHRISNTQPKCLRTIQELTICTRCEALVNTTTISQVYIYCCE